MTANLSAAATKTLATFATVAHIDCYAGTKGIDLRTLASLVRKGFLVKVAGGYNRHAITGAGRVAIGAPAPSAEVAVVVLEAEIVEEPAPATDGIIYLPADHQVTYVDDAGYPIDVATNQRLSRNRWAF